MPAIYANKFVVETYGNVMRIVFVDERLPVSEGMPKAVSTVAEVVMETSNMKQLGKLLLRMADER